MRLEVPEQLPRISSAKLISQIILSTSSITRIPLATLTHRTTALAALPQSLCLQGERSPTHTRVEVMESLVPMAAPPLSLAPLQTARGPMLKLKAPERPRPPLSPLPYSLTIPASRIKPSFSFRESTKSSARCIRVPPLERCSPL